MIKRTFPHLGPAILLAALMSFIPHNVVVAAPKAAPKGRSAAPGKPQPPPVTNSGAGKQSLFAAPRKTTFIIIDSNVPNADVSIDGILAGAPGKRIEADPGRVEVSLSAPGYQTKVQIVTVVKGKDTRVRIDLTKPVPKAKPKPPPTPVAKAPAPRGRKPVAATGKNLAGSKKKSLLFSEEEETENLPDSLPAAAPSRSQAAAAAPIPQQAAPATPPNAGYVAPPTLPQQPYVQQQAPYYGYQQPYAPPQPYAPQPYGYAPAPQPYAQPYGYAPAPQPYAQPYGGYAPYSPPVDPYAPAPLEPSGPVGDPLLPSPLEAPPTSSIYEDTGSDIDSFKPPSGDGGSRRPNRGRSTPDIYSGRRSGGDFAQSSADDGAINIGLALLPLGAGQFSTGRVGMGAFFLVAEGAAAGAGLYFYTQATAYEADAKVKLAAAKASTELSEEQKTTYQRQLETELGDLYQKAYISLGVAGGLWVVGSAESIINAPGNDVRGKSRNNRPSGRSRNLSMIHLDQVYRNGLQLSWTPQDTVVNSIHPELSLLLLEKSPRDEKSERAVGFGVNLEL